MRFPARTSIGQENPVTFPPGRARLLMRPAPTGSMLNGMTIGIVLVAWASSTDPFCCQRDDHVDSEPDEFGRKSREAVEHPVGEPVRDNEILSLDVTPLGETL